MSVIRRLGVRLCPFNSLRKKRSAAPSIAPWLDQDVDDVTVLVDGRPEILLTTLNVHEEFVQVPGVAQPSLLALETTGVRRPNVRHHCRIAS